MPQVSHISCRLQSPFKPACITGHAVQVQHPFLEQITNIQQPILGPQNDQKQTMDLLMSRNQRMINLEKGKAQI